MVIYECSTHAQSLLEGFNCLRLNGYSTDMQIVSEDGKHFRIHRLLLHASTGIDEHMHAQSHYEQLYLKASGLAVKIFIEFLYTGRLDLSNSSDNVVQELLTLAEDYHIKSLHHTLSCLKQRISQDLTDSHPSQKPLEECSQPGISEHDSSMPRNNSEMRIGEEQPVDNTNEEVQCDNQRNGQKESTKLQLKKFLHQKAKSDKKIIDISSPAQANSLDISASFHKTVCCHLCGKIIAKKGFPAHMKVHCNIKDKTCEICGKRFRKACNLQEHWQRMHMSASDKPYTCSRCGACFAIKSDLTRHVLRHDAKTCFVCELCGASFVGKRMWRKHKCMDDIFHSTTADLAAAFGEDTSQASNDQGSTNMQQEEEEDILNISTLLPLGFTDDSGANEILSEIDGLFYENQTLNS